VVQATREWLSGSLSSSLMNVDLRNIDCVEYLQSLPDNSVDLIIADPPYFIGFDGGRGWDKQWKSEDDYLAWCATWTKECVRVLRPGACWWSGYPQDRHVLAIQT